MNLALRQGRLLAVIVALLLAGCGTTPGTQTGPSAASPHRVDPWDRNYPQSVCVTTAHYHIFTDLRGRDTHRQVAQLMEGAFEQYQLLVSAQAPSKPPMRCYVFWRRAEWASFTAAHAGPDAATYLRIGRGAYAVEDSFVAFWLGDRGTFATMAHEGWHQYLARHCKQQMVPVLEEGIACTFENISWDGDLPRWNLKQSPVRSAALRDAIKDQRLWPLPRLVRLHAGEIISLPREQIETFYAQSWALAMYLLRDSGRYRTAMDRYFTDLAAGTAYRPAEFAHFQRSEWHPELSAPQFEHYLGVSLADLDVRYQAYCRELASRAPQLPE